jgi:WD40 repeat protein
MDSASHHYSRDFPMVPVFRSFQPRQFEFAEAPEHADYAAVGTDDGCVFVGNHRTGKVVGVATTVVENSNSDQSVLGVCWFRRTPGKFITGTSSGAVKMFDASEILASPPSPEIACATLLPTCSFPPFHRLTCVHLNADDSRALVCGYSRSVAIYDVATAQRIRVFQDVHEMEHINISRFANISPNIFATSSMDLKVKLWDLRVGSGAACRPIYTLSSQSPNITLAFRADDLQLLTSALDNEVRIYMAVDGSQYCQLDIQRKGTGGNFTRAYFADGGASVISGSCEESVIRWHSSSTGEALRTVQLNDDRSSGSSMFVQSLRGHPTLLGEVS